MNHVEFSTINRANKVETGQETNQEEKAAADNLIRIIEEDNIDEFRPLVENKIINIGTVNKEKKTLLHQTARYGSIKISEFLLTNGIDVNQVDIFKHTALYYSIVCPRTLNCDLIKLLSEKTESCNINEEQLLSSMVADNNIEVVKILLDHGADVNIADIDGTTPLHYVNRLSTVNMDMAKLLLENGANIEAKDVEGISPLSSAIYAHDHCKTEFAIFLIKNSQHELMADQKNIIRVVVRSNMHKHLRLLIQKKVNINYTYDESQETTLHLAIKNYSKHIIEILLKNSQKLNIDINAPDDTGRTPLHYAVEYKDIDTVELLLKYGANKNARTHAGKTPRDLAITRDYSAAVDLLNNNKN